MLENARFGYLENYWTKFHQTFNVDAFWDRDECFNFWGQKVKGEDHSKIVGPAGGAYRS